MSSPRIFVLNSLIGIPTRYPTGPYEGGPDSELYLFDYDYSDQTSACLSTLTAIRSAQHLDFSSKTLLLVARGLHPGGPELIKLAREFRTHHVFFELWNGLHELQQLCDGRIENLYFFPVSTHLRQASAPRVTSSPNRRVFVSLGGDDDLDLIRRVISQCPDLHFCVPNVSWAKQASQKRYLDVPISSANVTTVDCSAVRRDQQLTFSSEYRLAYDSCDTVLIANVSDKLFQMRGGLRLADALYARKHIVITENAMCQLLMAQHEKTCLVAAHDPESVGRQLGRICEGGFRVVESTYEEIRHLTVAENKLVWMLDAANDPASARRSIFARDKRLIESEVERLLGRTLMEILLVRPRGTPSAPPPWGLVRPLAAGSLVAHGWHVADLGGVVDGGCELALRNEQGGERRVLLCRNDGRPNGIVYTDRFDLLVMNDSKGRNLPTDEGFAQAVAQIAHVLAANENEPQHEPLMAVLLTHAERRQRSKGSGNQPDREAPCRVENLSEVLTRNESDLPDAVHQATFDPIYLDWLGIRERRLKARFEDLETASKTNILLVNATLGLPLYPSIVDFFALLAQTHEGIRVTGASYFGMHEFHQAVAAKGLDVASIADVMTWGAADINGFDVVIFVGPSDAMARLMALPGVTAKLVLLDLGFYHQLLESYPVAFLKGAEVIDDKSSQMNRVVGYSCQPEDKVTKDLAGVCSLGLLEWRWLNYIPIGFSYCKYYRSDRQVFDVALLGTGGRDYAQVDPHLFRGMRFLFLGAAELVPEIQRLRAELGVTVVSQVDQDTYARLLALCRCVVLPASVHVKNVFMSVVDAVATGRALVTSRHVGLARLERDHVPAVFYDASSADLFRQVHTLVRREPERLEDIEARSIAFAKEKLDIYQVLWTILEEQVL